MWQNCTFHVEIAPTWSELM